VSGSARFDYAHRFFTEATTTPIIVTTAARAAAVAEESDGRAEAVGTGDDTVDLVAAFTELRARGWRNALVEGGPTLNNDLGTASLLDELCLTLSPRIVAGDGPRILAGPPIMPPLAPRLVHMLEDDGFMFLRLALAPR
jgi:riboflavin biosynthesis pyrimidine reductase